MGGGNFDIETEESPLSIGSKIEHLNGLALKNNQPTFLISDKEESQILDGHNALKYAKYKMKEAGELMSKNTDNGQLYEFHKGQFLAFRQVVDPHYR